MAIVVPFLTPVLAYNCMTGKFDCWFFVYLVPMLLLQILAMLAVEFPDSLSDRQAGKQNLVVLLGNKWATVIYVSLLVFTYCMVFFLDLMFKPSIPLTIFYCTLPFAFWQIKGLLQKEHLTPRKQETFAFASIMHLNRAALIVLFGFFYL